MEQLWRTAILGLSTSFLRGSDHILFIVHSVVAITSEKELVVQASLLPSYTTTLGLAIMGLVTIPECFC